MRKLTARTAVFFTLLCAIGCAGHKLNLANIIHKADGIKIISMDAASDFYDYQLVKLGQKFHLNELDRDGLIRAKAKLDSQVDQLRDLLIDFQAVEISLANTYDLWKATGSPADQEKVNELIEQLMILTSRVHELMAEMRVE